MPFLLLFTLDTQETNKQVELKQEFGLGDFTLGPIQMLSCIFMSDRGHVSYTWVNTYLGDDSKSSSKATNLMLANSVLQNNGQHFIVALLRLSIRCYYSFFIYTMERSDVDFFNPSIFPKWFFMKLFENTLGGCTYFA